MANNEGNICVATVRVSPMAPPPKPALAVPPLALATLLLELNTGRQSSNVEWLTEAVQHTSTVACHLLPLAHPRTNNGSRVQIHDQFYVGRPQRQRRVPFVKRLWHRAQWDFEVGDRCMMCSNMMDMELKPQLVPPTATLLPMHDTTIVILPKFYVAKQDAYAD